MSKDNEVIERIHKSKKGAEFDAHYSGKGVTDKIQTIKVSLPNTEMTFEEEEEYLQREFGVGRFDSSDDVPADEDCEGIFELEIARGGN